jgi:CHAD domain-containing protein
MNTFISENTNGRLIELIRQALEKAWRTYLTRLKRCRAEFSNDAVHDLRVATRRIMAVIQLLNSMAPRPRLKKLIHAFKEQLDEFDDLRDTQVMLAEISKTVQELPKLQGFQKRQQDVQEKILKQLRKKISKFQTSDIKRRIRKSYDALEKESADVFGMRILQAVDDAYLTAKERLERVDRARPSTIHRVRVKFKSFRYMVEVVHPMLDNFPPQHLKWMNDYQSLMGELQDAEVFLKTLNDYAESASSLDLEPVYRYYERRHAESISAYMQDMNQLQTFWRAAPDQPFFWEKST